MSEQNLRDKIFTSKNEKRFFGWYRRTFSIKEIEESTLLQWFFGATLLSFLATFNFWISSSAITVQQYLTLQHTCWPWFPSCGEYYFLEKLPYGYTHGLLYMILFGVMLVGVYLMYKRDWVLAHISMFVLFAWKAVAGLILTSQLYGNYDYYHMVFALILLFFPLKTFFLKLSFILLYVLAASAKIHETWILGTYFSSLQTGLPIFPDWSIPIWTNIVLLMQIVGSWFLLSKNTYVQRAVLVFFIVFHLYSGLLVNYHYPLLVLPSLIILFGIFYKHEAVPLSKKSIAGWVLIVSMISLQMISVIIPGDERLTLEGNRFGLYMFEANHQCISMVTINGTNDTTETLNSQSNLARNRCDPYRKWFQIQEYCKRRGEVAEEIHWTFDHSINGGPFYRIVDTVNACDLEYKSLSHNVWIKTPAEGAEIQGYPVKNLYY